jgi:hypothetical protein
MITAFTGIAFAILTATRIGFHKEDNNLNK